MSVCALVYMDGLNERSDKCMTPPFLWSEYLSGVLARSGRFRRRYRMRFNAFSQLCSLVEPKLRVLHPYTTVRVEIVLHCMRWLARGSYEDISAIALMTVSSFFVM
jgi:hypothetical protein